MPTATMTKPKRRATKRKSTRTCGPIVSAKWRRLITQIPGYDPIKTAARGEWFDPKAAQLALDFFPECLKHIEGQMAGQPFVLERWQQASIANLFGWKRKDRSRRYRKVLLYVPRKNGKTPMSAGIELYVFFCDEEQGQQNYIAAANTEQAALDFRWARGMVEREPLLLDRATIYGGRGGFGHKAIVSATTGSYIKVISADAHTKHGQNPHCVLFDELHAQPNRELFDTFATSFVSLNRRQPLFVCITTADFQRESICNEEYDYACKVRDGIVKDSSYLPVIYEADPKDDWTDPRTWAKANPNLGVSVSQEALQEACDKAKELPQRQNEFKRLHLNIRTERATAWLDMTHWSACGHDVADPVAWRQEMLAELRGRQCHAGLDLGSTRDLTALVLIFDEDSDETGPEYILLPWFWCPLDAPARKDPRIRALYETWMRQGFMTGTPGNVADYRLIRSDINDLADAYGIAKLAVDRLFQGAQLCTELLEDGHNVIAHGQGYLSMAAPTKAFEESVIAHKLRHGNNPVLNWMAANVTVAQDQAGNLKPTKPGENSPLKIDGIVAAIMGMGYAVAGDPTGTSVYDDPTYGL